MRKPLKTAGTLATICLFVLTILIFRSGLWMLDTWPHLSIDELIFHLQAPMKGTSEGLVFSYIRSCLLTALIMGVLLSFVLFFFRKNKILYRVVHGIALVFSPLMIAFTIYFVWSSLQFTDYVEAQNTYSSFIDTNYVSPSDVQITFPKEKRNLIHIYLESMETTYSDPKNGGQFEENLIPELTKIAQTYEDFSGSEKKINGAITLPGSTWTMGALFAQTSGLPLFLPIDGNAMGSQSSFLPNLITMGDVLEEAGYQQSFLIGSQAEFGGRKLYFTDHGNYRIWDYNYFVTSNDIPSDYFVWWGFEDRYLIEFAKEKLTWLSTQSEPFNLTMLTVDTHYEDGYVCSDCKSDIENNPYANVMRCSSSKIAELVSWIQKQDFYENTTIVLTGDHLTMDSDFCSNISADYQRKVYTAYINAPIETDSSGYREYSTYDIFPTTLASLGVKIEGNRLGLGTNLFSNTPTLCEEFGTSYINRELRKKSKLMDELTSDIAYAKGAISISPYKAFDNSFQVLVNSLDHSVTIQDILCLVWTKENREDAKWYSLPYMKGEEYSFIIPLSDFSNAETTYQVEAFAYTENAMMYSLGQTAAEIAK